MAFKGHGTKSVMNPIMAIGLGLTQAWALSVPLGGEYSAVLQVVCFAVFIRTLEQVRKTFQIAWLFSTAWLAGSVWWLHIAMHDHGHLPFVISIAAIGLLCGGLALYYASAIYVYSRYKKHLNQLQQGLLLSACWTLAEMARAQWLTGFPWAAVGYAQIDSYLSFAAPWVGVYGIGFCAIFLAVYLSNISKKSPAWIKGSVILASAMLLINVVRVQSAEPSDLSVALLQGNIPQDIKFTSGRQEALDWYKKTTIASEEELTVLPETALPYLASELPVAYWSEIERKFKDGKQVAVVGMLTHTQTEGYGNSAVALGLGHEPKIYNKYHLVPFGEFTPDTLKWFTKMMSLGIADFERGSDKPEPFAWRGHKLAINICYEDVFGEELAKRFVQGQDKAPTVLVNISNIDWFGDTSVIKQHLSMARMRSLEFNRPSIRATNSGGTAIINAQGQIVSSLKPFTRGVLTGDIVSRDKEITPYAYWAGNWGLKPMWLLCLLISLVLIRHSAKKSQLAVINEVQT